MNAAAALGELFTAAFKPGAALQWLVVLACLGLAAGAVLLIRRATADAGILLGDKGWDGVLFPVLAFLLAWGAQHALAPWLRLPLLALALPVLACLSLVRISAKVLHAAFAESATLRAVSSGLSWLAWIALGLWLSGLMPLLVVQSEAVHWHIGGSPVSLRSLLEGSLSALAVLLLALWLSARVEAHLMAASSINLSVRKISANAARAVLLLVGLLLALSAAGIPLGALSVLGGALGVGIGLGLQRLAANYVSGFVILAERSLRIGDVVKVDGFEGQISDIGARYTLIRAINGRESIVPNELMTSQRVENCSLADPQVALTSSVHVAYGTDLPALMPKLVAAMQAVPRVLAEPGPAVQLSQFGANGLELTLVFWIADMALGQANVRSDINLAVLATLDAEGVEIPLPQQVTRTV